MKTKFSTPCSKHSITRKQSPQLNFCFQHLEYNFIEIEKRLILYQKKKFNILFSLYLFFNRYDFKEEDIYHKSRYTLRVLFSLPRSLPSTKTSRPLKAFSRVRVCKPTWS